MAARIQIHRTSTANSPPTANYLLPGELAIEMNAPVRLWSGVPTALDATGRKLIFQLPLTVAQGGTGATTQADAVTNLGGPFAPLTNGALGANNYAPLANPTFTGTMTLSAAVNGTNLPLSLPTGAGGRPIFIDSDNNIKRLNGFEVFDTNQTGLALRSANNTFNFFAYFTLRKTRGTHAAPLALQTGDILGNYEFKGWPVPAAGETAGKSSIGVWATQNFTAAAAGQAMDLNVVTQGTTIPRTILTLDSNPTLAYLGCRSRVRMNSDTGTNLDGPEWIISAWHDALALGREGSTWGETWWMVRGTFLDMLVNGNLEAQGTITPGSDARDKEAIAPLEYGLTEVRKLQARRWFWRKGEHTPQAGVVAQELEPIIPEAVVTKEHPRDKRDHKYVNPMALIGVLIKAVQQLADRLDALEAR